MDSFLFSNPRRMREVLDSFLNPYEDLFFFENPRNDNEKGLNLNFDMSLDMQTEKCIHCK